MRELPSGTVTFLITDVEGSTKLLHEFGAEAYAEALAEHRRLIREACAAHGGVEVDTQGDAFFFAFPTAPAALAAAEELTATLASGPIQVRVGLHTGTPLLTEEGYIGGDVHRAARIGAAGHGGQVLVSASTAALIGPSGSEPQGLLDLGEHRLKDLSAPERIYQLGKGAFPPLQTLYQTNLPIPTTPFLGRERELGEVVALLERDDVRLLTLTGAGGSGKTRLALQAAAEVSGRYEHGVWWVPLAALHDPELVLEQAGQALGARGSVSSTIAGKRLLLVLDNFEQVIEAGPHVAELLSAQPGLNVLVTSRESLRVGPEQEYAVLPLEESDAVDLFVARARAVVPEFAAGDVVAEICRRLDQLPLAVELAAARVRVLPPEQILAHLEQRLPFLVGGVRDAPERQRTLRATIAWSYELLSAAEQTCFARLGVFAGGFTLEAARRISSADLDLLESLVAKSLLRHSEGRYLVLETLREFALERLEERGEATSVGDRHARYFAGLADCRWPEYMGGDTEFRDFVAAERRNLSAALDWALARRNGEDALAIVSGVHASWVDYRRGRQVVEQALALPAERLSRRRGIALLALGELVAASGDVPAAKRAIEQAIAVFRRLDEPPFFVAAGFTALAEIVLDEGDVDTARDLAEEAIRIRREELDSFRLGRALQTLVMIERAEGDLERALELAEEAVEYCLVQTPESLHLAYFIADVGEIKHELGDRAGALTAFTEALRAALAQENSRALHRPLEGVAAIRAELGDVETAARLCGAVERAREESGWRRYRPREFAVDRNSKGWDEGRKMSLAEAAEYALARLSDA